MSTPTPRLVPIVLLLLAACGTPQEWVNPIAPIGQRDGDMRDCRAAADYQARRETAFRRDRAMWDAHSARSPGERAMANARLHQAGLVATLDRNRMFEHCMHARGYALRDAPPR